MIHLGLPKSWDAGVSHHPRPVKFSSNLQMKDGTLSPVELKWRRMSSQSLRMKGPQEDSPKKAMFSYGRRNQDTVPGYSCVSGCLPNAHGQAAASMNNTRRPGPVISQGSEKERICMAHDSAPHLEGTDNVCTPDAQHRILSKGAPGHLLPLPLLITRVSL
ncbi:hypothetical protein AAY473_031332 [Plecturocebus cupreus]